MLRTETYTYDAAGNRIKQGGAFARTTIPPALFTVSYNVNNQQTTFGTNTLTYDLNGNLATATDAGVGTETKGSGVSVLRTRLSRERWSRGFTHDEGRSLEVGVQAQISNRGKRRRSRVVVVSVARKGGTYSVRYESRRRTQVNR